jgi:hypothetical protein
VVCSGVNCTFTYRYEHNWSITKHIHIICLTMWPVGTSHNFLQYVSTQVPTEYGDSAFLRPVTAYLRWYMASHPRTKQYHLALTCFCHFVGGVMTVTSESYVTGRTKNVVFFDRGEPGCAPLCVGLLSERGSVDGDVFPAFRWRAPFWGLPTDINEFINRWLWRRSISLHRDTVGEHGGGLPSRGL